MSYTNQFSGPRGSGRGTDIIVTGTEGLPSAYSSWFGKSVVLLVAIRRCQIPMPCRIVSVTFADVCIRIKHGWEMDVRKELILAVEEAEEYVVALDKQIS
jgi:hypothetical protein